jgi:hypothetical protein
MALTAASMAAKVKTYVMAVAPVLSIDPGSVTARQDAVILAMCQGIIEEIQQNGTVITADSHGDAGTGTIV